ncbi:MAG: (4Fe-4S)-binding protein [Desulfobulbus propionicus]|nr:MAG: (4Fe-4S)-binding protein [Desulfobulbus propionicus]
MIISVASGKGGTGKTTIATNLACSFDTETVELLDCDVEEPNAHLFLKPEITGCETVSTPVPLVDEQQCTGCRKCSAICRFNAITVVGQKVLVFPELCHGCGGCMEVCPEAAITEQSRNLGIVEFGRRGALTAVSGRLRVGEAMSPPLIKAVRAQAGKRPLTIIDAPPGTSCPVISAMKGTDFVVLVTEPTPFGLHDLVLAHEAVKLLGIPCGLVINRAGMGDDRTHAYAETSGLPILMEIPFDRRIAECYSRGQLMVKALPEWSGRFRTMYGRIEQLVHEQGGTA